MSAAIILLFLILMFLGVPIATSLGLASVIVMATKSTLPLNMAAQSMFTAMNSFIMVAVPLFILCGSLMDEGGIADRIYDLAEALVGWIYGGLGHVSVVVNMLFAGMSGSSVAAIASIGKMSINALEKKGYPKDYATAINLSGSMLASVIPPSILMINAAATGNVSIGQALLAGLIPGIIIGIIFMVYNYFYCRRHGIGDRVKFSGKKLGKAFVRAIPALLTPIILLGGVYTGVYTPTEGAAIAVVYTMIVSVYVFKTLKWTDMPRIIIKNARSTGTILFVAIAAKPASVLFEIDGLPSRVAQGIAGISDNRIVILFVLYAFLIVVGMFMDATAAIFILVPILLPACQAVGVSPLFFTVFLVITLSFGLITPPVGVCLYAAENVTGLPLERIIKASIPWILLIAVSLCIFILFPQIIEAPVALVFGT
ncbi:TRAP transporter large permease [Porcincola intestinalis]|jgi:C4-dicarboxylate transporter DctM subunit|uniref:TRAP transporter large permease n=1 Tax=Porcincola intestinalis TaxID=2606632 RepID=A0A6L5X8Y9_9FIRM|nr:TRAP transporter large permease [Porcincola intestinalis]MCI6698311.1 TRAP transporter large permease [Lachnospiraceae bacterium]MCI6767126.1 TRAP transporter large permease [Lachnospiraceae bacterium]MDD7061221.1 TRAP transporter large permease [Porcincola intestinalis]MDY4205772.1 TRAP transporter large permease [Porcincola intestinalis]MDY5283598.1 TRAP transporter large permease [Porcincola intestinalis]